MKERGREEKKIFKIEKQINMHMEKENRAFKIQRLYYFITEFPVILKTYIILFLSLYIIRQIHTMIFGRPRICYGTEDGFKFAANLPASASGVLELQM